MVNLIEVYRAAGTKAGIAQNNGDAALVKHWHEWRNKAIALEQSPDKETARAAYAEAYRTARRV